MPATVGLVVNCGGNQKKMAALERMLVRNPGRHPPSQVLKMTAQKKSELGTVGNTWRNCAVRIAATAANRIAAPQVRIAGG